MSDGYDRPREDPPLPDPASTSGTSAAPRAGATADDPSRSAAAPLPEDGQGARRGWAIAGGAALLIALIVVVIVLASEGGSKHSTTITNQSLSIGHTTTVNPQSTTTAAPSVTSQTTVTAPTTTVTAPAKTTTVTTRAPTTTGAATGPSGKASNSAGTNGVTPP